MRRFLPILAPGEPFAEKTCMPTRENPDVAEYPAGTASR